MFFTLIVFFNNFSKNIIGLLVLISLLILIFFTMIFNNDYTFGYGVQSLVLITGYTFAIKVRFNFFVNCYSKILYYLSITSLFFFCIFTLLPDFIEFFPIISKLETQYANLIVYIHYMNMGKNSIKSGSKVKIHKKNNEVIDK